MFDHTIKPILLYGCDVWGAFNPFASRFRNGIISCDKIFSNLVSEKLHLKFCKKILGTHKKSSNIAVLSELGRFPLHFDIVKCLLKFWHRLENLDASFPLLKNAYITSKNLFTKKLPSWYGSIDRLSNCLGFSLQNINVSSYSFKKNLNKCVYSYYLREWKNKLVDSSHGKLRTYTSFKTNFGLENYLKILSNFELRRSITKFRISAHKLMIEQGRYIGIPSQNRICSKCSLNEVEDEIH